eukprot:m51a1_g13859 hypothetical protein (423) ;mRNA; r:593681-594949
MPDDAPPALGDSSRVIEAWSRGDLASARDACSPRALSLVQQQRSRSPASGGGGDSEQAAADAVLCALLLRALARTEPSLFAPGEWSERRLQELLERARAAALARGCAVGSAALAMAERALGACRTERERGCATWLLAAIHEYGVLGAAGSTLEAVRLYRAAAALGNACAQNNLGYCIFRGDGAPADCAEAARLYRLSSAQGNAAARFNLALMLTQGDGVERDVEEAIGLYKQAAAQGLALAMHNLALLYAERGQKEEAARLMEQASERGHSGAQNYLGVMLKRGDGVPVDLPRAVRMFRESADQGNNSARFNLSAMLHDGVGVPRDKTEALRLLRLAADQGLAAAQSRLAALLFDGDGVEQDRAEAARLFALAAEQGLEPAKKLYALMLAVGDHVEQDVRTASVLWGQSNDPSFLDTLKAVD